MLDVLCGISGGREGDDVVRENLAEAVLCLARAEPGRRKLWECRAPELLQKGYEFEETPAVCAAYEAAAELFLADGFQPAAAGGEGGSVEGVAGAQEGAVPALVAGDSRPDVPY